MLKQRLKNETMEQKVQIASIEEDNKIIKEKYKSMFEKFQQESRRKQLTIEELKNKVIFILVSFFTFD